MDLKTLTKQELHTLISDKKYEFWLGDIAAELRRRRENHIIVPTKECNVGNGELTINQAGNAIWNKLNASLSYIDYSDNVSKQFVKDRINEAREIADQITNL